MMNEEFIQSEFKTIRENLDLTMAKFGQYLGVSRQQIYNIEHKRTKLSKAQMLAIFYILMASPQGEDIIDYLCKKSERR